MSPTSTPSPALQINGDDSASSVAARADAWPLERVLFAMAGTFSLAGAVLAAFVSPWFLLMIAFVGANQLLYVIAHNCGASMMLKRLTDLKSVVYPQR